MGRQGLAPGHLWRFAGAFQAGWGPGSSHLRGGPLQAAVHQVAQGQAGLLEAVGSVRLFWRDAHGRVWDSGVASEPEEPGTVFLQAPHIAAVSFHWASPPTQLPRQPGDWTTRGLSVAGGGWRPAACLAGGVQHCPTRALWGQEGLLSGCCTLMGWPQGLTRGSEGRVSPKPPHKPPWWVPLPSALLAACRRGLCWSHVPPGIETATLFWVYLVPEVLTVVPDHGRPGAWGLWHPWRVASGGRPVFCAQP